MSNSQSVVKSTLPSLCDKLENQEKAFWQIWNQYRDDLYRCCLKWMNGNPTDAEDVLSLAMLKAWHKFREGNHVISNFQAWLTKLTYNLCLDLHRQHSRNTNRVESLDTGEFSESELISKLQTPESAVMGGELEKIIHRAIEELPPRLGEPCFLHIIQDKSYQEIGQQLGISYDNVCKRISQGRQLLQKRLKKYLSEFDDSLLNSSQLSGKQVKSGVNKIYGYEMRANFRNIPVNRPFKTSNDFSPSYQVIALCLETLPHAWYHSINPLEWS